MATFYTYTTEKYGPLPHQHMIVGRPTQSATAKDATDRWAYVFVPGGGWGLRDPATVVVSATNGNPYVGRESLMNGAFDLDNGGGDPVEAATVFILNVASESQNATAGQFATSPSVENEYSGYVDSSLQHASTGPWEVNDIYYGTSSGAHICRKATSSPPTAGQSTDEWQLYDSNAAITGRRAGGEGSPGSGAQSARDVQRAISYIRKRSGHFQVSKNKVLLQGNSAGAQAAALAAYTDPIAFGHKSHISASHLDVAYEDCRPNGLIAGIAACKLEEFATEDKNASQSLFLSFMSSLFGEPLNEHDNWLAMPDAQKRGADPASAMLSAGYYVPTFFIYNTDSGMSNIWSREHQVQGVAPADYATWNANTNYAQGDLVKHNNGAVGDQFYICVQAHNPTSDGVSAPTQRNADTAYWAYTPLYGADEDNGSWDDHIHHSQNGREFMRLVSTSRANGGLGLDTSSAANSDVRFLVKDFAKPKLTNGLNNTLTQYTVGTTDQYLLYYSAPTDQQFNLSQADKESQGWDSTLSVTGSAQDKAETISTEVLSFFNSTRRTRYI